MRSEGGRHGRRGLIVALVLLWAGPGWAGFEDDFTGATLRLDLYHSGTATEERWAGDRARIEGPWPGSQTALLDDSGLGAYLAEVVDLASNRPLYSRGFADTFAEWQTTPEAIAGTWRTFPEAIRFPEPRQPVQVRIRRRGTDGIFREIWSSTVDPAAPAVDRAPVGPQTVWTLEEGGAPAVKLDLLLLGDGYTAAERDKFHADARRLADVLLRTEPFASRRGDLNIRAIDTATPASGVARPQVGEFRRTALGTTYNAFGSERYVLTFDDRAWRDVAAAAPYDFIAILANNRTYGGGGIYNLYATAAAGSEFSPYVFVHELGHSLGGLGDEYYTSPVAYEAPAGEIPEPWEPNLATGRDPRRLKWSDLLTGGIAVPTPWGKADYEKASLAFQDRRRKIRAENRPEEEMEALFREERELFTRTLGAEPHAGKVGAFEGAGYQATGMFRPSADCIMFTRDPVAFCAVCRRAIERVIDRHAR